MVTISDTQPHYIDQLGIRFKIAHTGDRIAHNWAVLPTKIGQLRVARLDRSDGDIEIAAFLFDTLVALLKIYDGRECEDDKLPWLAIGKTSVVEEHRGNGIMPALILLWIEQFCEPLLSDVTQSQDAYRMWKLMACRNDAKYEVLVWQKDGLTTPIKCVDHAITPNPADDGDSTRWLVRPLELQNAAA